MPEIELRPLLGDLGHNLRRTVADPRVVQALAQVEQDQAAEIVVRVEAQSRLQLRAHRRRVEQVGTAARPAWTAAWNGTAAGVGDDAPERRP